MLLAIGLDLIKLKSVYRSVLKMSNIVMVWVASCYFRGMATDNNLHLKFTIVGNIEKL